jgi:gluconolactonase
MRLPLLLAGLALALASAVATAAVPSVEARLPDFAGLVPTGASVEVLAEGFQWAEGPVWVPDGAYLLLSDVPRNRIYRWAPGDRAAAVFMEPSGGTVTAGFREPGSNGLQLGGPDTLLVADQGNRRIAIIGLRSKVSHTIADRYRGKRFNSPNDLTPGPNGTIWFTDPPYGLEGLDASPLKEQPVNGVYRLADNKVTLVEAGLRFPNGIALSPDGRTLYVSNSDPQRAVILAFDLSPSAKPSNRRVFADMTARAAKGLPGLPDGMCVDERGDLWATGPGGIHVFAPDGRELGLVSTGAAVSNCTFGGPDGRTLFMTSTHVLAALRTSVRGAPAWVQTRAMR